jgi:hypothetical protein
MYEQGTPLQEYHPSTVGWMTIPIGPTDGLGYYGNNLRPAKFVFQKASTLSVGVWWRQLGQTSPEAA